MESKQKRLVFGKIQRKHSVITKIIVVYLLTAALPLMLIGITYALLKVEKADDELRESMHAQFSQAQQELDRMFSDAIAIGRTISRTPSVISLIENDFSTSEMVTNLRYNVLPLIETVRSIRGSGNVQIIHAGAHISPVYNSVVYDPAFFEAFQHEEGNLASGFLYSITIEPDRVYFADINRDDQTVFSVVHSIRPANGLTTIGFVRITFPAETVLRDVFQASLGEAADIRFYSDEKPVYPAQETLPDQSGEADTLLLSQQSRLYGYEVVCRVPKPEKAPTNVYLTAYLIGFALVSILAIGLIVASMILKPLRKAAEAMESFSAGNLGYRMEESGKDEVGMLAHTYNAMAKAMQRLLEELRAVQMAEKKAIYGSLVSQVRPHFLNNALDAVRMRAVVEGNPDMARQLEAIIHYLRYNIGNVDTFVSLEEEIASVTDYIAMQNLATREEISFELFLDHDAAWAIEQCRIPKFILQPIVENSLNHGFHADRTKRILLRIEPEDGCVRITVEDNGSGMTTDRLREVRESLAENTTLISSEDAQASIGLNNILQRLRIYYSNNATLTVESFEGTGTSVTITLPMEPPPDRFM